MKSRRLRWVGTVPRKTYVTLWAGPHANVHLEGREGSGGEEGKRRAFISAVLGLQVLQV